MEKQETQFKGTKRKWELELFNGKGNVIDIVSYENPNGETIAQVYSLVETNYKTPFNEEILANALLMSKSREILNALISIERCFSLTESVRENLRKLIKEATDTNPLLIEAD